MQPCALILFQKRRNCIFFWELIIIIQCNFDLIFCFCFYLRNRQPTIFIYYYYYLSFYVLFWDKNNSNDFDLQRYIPTQVWNIVHKFMAWKMIRLRLLYYEKSYIFHIHIAVRHLIYRESFNLCKLYNDRLRSYHNNYLVVGQIFFYLNFLLLKEGITLIVIIIIIKKVIMYVRLNDTILKMYLLYAYVRVHKKYSQINVCALKKSTNI